MHAGGRQKMKRKGERKRKRDTMATRINGGVGKSQDEVPRRKGGWLNPALMPYIKLGVCGRLITMTPFTVNAN